jgi:hypothetical protein
MRSNELIRKQARGIRMKSTMRAAAFSPRTHELRFLRAANADFAALKGDGKAWTQELHDRELWKNGV